MHELDSAPAALAEPRICASGRAVWPPLICPMTSASASSTASLSIRPEPGIEGPPVWMVLWMPYLRAQATILGLVAGLDRAEADLAQEASRPAAARSLKSCSTMPFSSTGAPA